MPDTITLQPRLLRQPIDAGLALPGACTLLTCPLYRKKICELYELEPPVPRRKREPRALTMSSLQPNIFLLAADNHPNLIPYLRENPALASSQDSMY
jgi:hypothetical protein